MPRNNGIYIPPPSTWFPATDGNPATADDWNTLLSDISSALTQSVSKDGQTTMVGALPMGNQRIINLGAATANSDALRRAAIAKGADIASAATITIPNEGSLFTVTGTTGISTVTMPYDGKFAFLRFADVVVLTNSASLLLPSGRNYTTRAGDILLFIAIGGSNVQVFAGGAGSGFEIGDYLDTARTPDNTWLRRNGAIYAASDYPELASLFPPLPSGLIWSAYEPTGLEITTNPTRLSNGEFAVVGQNKFQKSADWETMSEAAEYRAGTFQTYTFCEAGGGTYVICASGGPPGPTAASGSFVSTDGGETFSQTGYPNNVPVNGLARFNDLFLAFCIDDKSVHTSPDGTAWTRRSTGWFGPNWAAYARYVIVGDDIFVVTSANDYFIWSADGVSWTNATNQHQCNDIAYSNGWFVTVGDGGEIKRTQNFKTGSWDTASSGTTKNLRAITENNGVLIAVGDGITLMSTNGGAGWVATGVDETRNITAIINHADDTNKFVGAVSGELLFGEIATSPTFRVPNDNPTNGWIKAL